MTTKNSRTAEQEVRLAVDAHGGEKGMAAILGGVRRFLERDSAAHILLVGDRGALERESAEYLPPPVQEQTSIRHAEEVIDEAENLNVSLRRKTSSSLHGIMDALSEGQAAACISSGNSAALMGVAQMRLGVFPEMKRPAFCCHLPHQNGCSYLLDVGANVDVPPQRLLQFAFLGAALAAGNGCARPRVALLNIGAEACKGNRQVSAAARLLQETGTLHYVGFVEGHQLFEDRADVIVCDGFAGNVALKASEGAASYLMRRLRQWPGERLRQGQEEAGPEYARDLDPRSHNGALLLGLRGMVVKSHGRSDDLAFFHSLEYAALQVRRRVLSALTERFTDMPDAPNTSLQNVS